MQCCTIACSECNSIYAVMCNCICSDVISICSDVILQAVMCNSVCSDVAYVVICNSICSDVICMAAVMCNSNCSDVKYYME